MIYFHLFGLYFFLLPSYIYIYKYTLKWIDPQENLVLGYLFFLNTCFWPFKKSSESKWFVLIFSLVFIVVTVLIRLWFFLILGFVCVNVQFELIREKQKNPKSIYRFMDRNTHADTQTHRIHSCKNRKRERNNICSDESLSWIINLNWTVIDTNLRIKKNHNPIKTVATLKTKGNTKTNHLFPEVRNMCWRKINNLKANSLVDLFIFKYLLFFLSLDQWKKIIHTYI